MRLGRAVAASVVFLGTGLAAACENDAFTVAMDASTDVDAGGLDAQGEAGSDGASDASTDGSVDAPAPVRGCESRADPQSPCSLSAPACTKSALWTPATDAGAPLSVFAITTDATHVYWVSQVDYNGPSLGVVYRVLKSGGTTEVLARNQEGPLSIAVDNGWVYWITTGLAGTTRTILRVPKAAVCSATCLTPQAVFSGTLGNDATIHVLADQDLYVVTSTVHFRHYFDPLLPGWRSGTSWPSGKRPSAAAGPHGIFAGAGDKTPVDRVSQDGTSTQKAFDVSVADAGPFPGATRMSKDCSSVFVVRDSVGDVLRFPQAGGSAVTVAPPRSGIYALHVDATFVYFGIADSGGIFRTVKKGGGPVDTLMLGNVWAITSDDTAVYWGDHRSGAVYRMVK